MSTDAIFDLTAAIVVFGSFLGVVYFRDIWKMTGRGADRPTGDHVSTNESQREDDFGS